MARAALALEDGTVYFGESFGAVGTVSGEVCFNTSMTGYQEILTDPSYRGQILAIGNRIRLAVNGQQVFDWTDPKPELCESGPLGLQLHSNKVPQEVRFRGLVLVEDPQDVLVTAGPTPAK